MFRHSSYFVIQTELPRRESHALRCLTHSDEVTLGRSFLFSRTYWKLPLPPRPIPETS